MEHNRFLVLGEEYSLFQQASPHYGKLQDIVGKTVRKAYSNKIQQEISVLELGCGPGTTTRVLLDTDPRIIVTAVDLEPKMIAQAKRNLADYVSSNRLSIIGGDGLEYLRTLKDSTFDVFASAFTLHNFSQQYRGRIISEIHRTLKPGGLFINADKYALDDPNKHNKSLLWQIEQFVNTFRSERSDLAVSWIKHYVEDNSPRLIMYESAARKQLEKNNFVDISTKYRKQMEAVMTATKK